jgi:phosphatidylserine decarboxylase
VITHYGIDILIWVFLVLVTILIGALVFFEAGVVRYVLITVVVLVGVFTLNFFRDPNRITPNEPNIVVSPADGKVVQIKRFMENEFLHGDAVQVSIFMSPLDVHGRTSALSKTDSKYYSNRLPAQSRAVSLPTSRLVRAPSSVNASG